MFSLSVTIDSRDAKKIVIHEGYKPELSDRSYNDIALIKFDRPFLPKTATHAKMMPICLPTNSKFNDEDKLGGILLVYHIIDQLLIRFCCRIWSGETKYL